MEFYRTVSLKNGQRVIIRNGTQSDAQAALDNFNLTHSQTEYLLSYPDEKGFSVEDEARFLKEKTESENEIELLAVLDGKVIGMAGIESIGRREKIRHRANLGISIDKAYWGLGLGKALMLACIECAKSAGYKQIELDAFEQNERAIGLYKSLGFEQFGRNPKAICTRDGKYQAMVLMRREV